MAFPHPHLHHLMPPMEYVRDIQPKDVLSGRGGATNAHSGNKEFRRLVHRHRREYVDAKKKDKPAVAKRIVDLVREEGGRFLQKVEGSPSGELLYYDIGDDKAREKTCQALREGAATRRRARETEEMSHRRRQGRKRREGGSSSASRSLSSSSGASTVMATSSGSDDDDCSMSGVRVGDPSE